MENVNKAKITDLEANKNVQGLEEMMTEAEGGYDLETAELVKQALDRVNGVSEKIDTAEKIPEATEKRVEDLGGSKEVVEEKLGENTGKMEELKEDTQEKVKEIESPEEAKETEMRVENKQYQDNEKFIEELNDLKKQLSQHLNTMIGFNNNHGMYSVMEYIKDGNAVGGYTWKGLDIPPALEGKLVDVFKEYYEQNPNPSITIAEGGDPRFIPSNGERNKKNTFTIKNLLNEFENDIRVAQQKILGDEGGKIRKKIAERAEELGYKNSGIRYSEMGDATINKLLADRDYVDQLYTQQGLGIVSTQ